ncbi:MAG TPA: MBOAT family O-acyltransferase [Xanthobacteraceae bacterium]|nr:MBOAT family O-acyltransferase [Xanthobacteraceae bacterium]
MIFNSFTYVFFLAIVVMVYWLLPRRPRQLFLFAASITFYGFWRFDYVFIMLVSAFTDYFAAINIHKAKAPAKRRLWLALSLTVNFGLLFYFKYANFLVGNINGIAHLLGRDDLLRTWSVVLPVGISFYTFQTVSYTVDVYRGRIEPIRDPLLYGLFVTFFVHLVAGPILRVVEVIPQLDRRKPFALEFLASGLWLILNGLFLKCVLADTIGGYVDEGFGANPATLSATDVWVLAVLFGFQIYFDFAAYSQIAIGSARLMGVIFPPNFYFPYVATSPRDFWRRWHISLSSWIRDYLYLPLCGVRPHDESRGGLVPVGEHVGAARRNVALVATWFIMGLWHGAGWTFALWGLWHALLILVQRVIAGLGVLRSHTRLRGALGWLLAFPAVMLGWVFFRAQSLDQAWAMLQKVLQPGRYLRFDRLHSGYLWSALPIGIDPVGYLIAAILPVATLVAYLVHRDLWPRWSRRAVVALPVAVAYGTVVAAFVFVYLRPVRQFIYFQF